MSILDSPIKIALIDDHALVREGLREILQAEDDFTVIGEAGDSQDAVTLIRDTKPNVALLDVQIPGDEVTSTVRRMREESPFTKVIILSIYDGASLVAALLAAGIRGYLLKSVSRHELLAAIRGIWSDDSRVVLSVSPESFARAHADEPVRLSQRELEVLRLVASGKSNSQIATRLGLSEATVKRHVHNIFSKLGAVSRIDAVNKAIAAALIDATAATGECQPGCVVPAARLGRLDGSYNPA